jgi:hypothetical protein
MVQGKDGAPDKPLQLTAPAGRPFTPPGFPAGPGAEFER